ncbi:C-terminal binding protein [Nitratireductor sp. XY-223]|uniref:C-terminal binding protein n=1 Tax=Nitratireductor sp. XY-223 TaxID=2561926 RepID=UPI0010AA605E|nr:C-terminal binding protein [Nitratireductor sp. XY-223]
MTYKVGVTDYVEEPHAIEREALGNDWEIVWLNAHEETDFDADRLADLDALLVWHAPITERVAKMLKKCRIVVRYGVGFDEIDVAALEAQGIAFCNTPDYGTEEVADTTVAMILMHLRRIAEYDYQCRNYTEGWQEHTLAPLERSRDRTLGVVGVGRIGSAVMRRMRPFGVCLVGYDPNVPSGHEKALDYQRATSLHSLLSQADIVTVHCPADASTTGMIDESFIAAMKPGSILVNTARGALINSLDVIEDGLRSGRLLAAALDVLPSEPPTDHPLIDAWRRAEPWLRGRFTITPHTAYYSERAWREMRYKAAETARLFFDAGIERNRIRGEDNRDRIL